MKHRLTGLASLLAIVLLLVGVPVGLYLAAGSPIPGGLPGVDEIGDALSSPDDGTIVLGLLKVIGWVAWASFATMILLEVAARLRGVRPPNLRALGVQQRTAAGLVGTAALLFTAAPLMTAAHASPAAAAVPAPSVVATPVSPAAGMATTGEESQPDQQPAQERAQPPQRTYVVAQGDSLYSIAETLLGDGARFHEIAELNYGVPQADGAALSTDHWLQPGWKLQVPAAEVAQDDATVLVEPGDTLSGIAHKELGDGTRYPELYAASSTTVQPGGERLVDPDLIQPGWTITIPHARGDADQRPLPAPGRSTQSPPTQQGDPVPQDSDEQAVPDAEQAQDDPATQMSRADAVGTADDAGEVGFPVRTASGIGALLAVGILGFIGLRRHRQQRHRKPGQQVPMPTDQAQAVEQELRTVADPMSVETVDLALRTLSMRCAEEGTPLPVVRAARLTADQFDLYLAQPARLPVPWSGTEDHTVWTLDRDDADLIQPGDAEAIPAPYPALVTLGHDEEDGHVLVDLEYLGSLAVLGEETPTRHVMAGMAVELATGRWADDLQVTIVGTYPELEGSLDSGRIRYMPVVGRLLEDLQRRAEQDRAALRETGALDLNHARTQNAAPGTWTPEIVLLAGPITDGQLAQLQELVSQTPRVAIATVTNGHTVGEWAIRLTGQQEAVLDPFGLALRPQMLEDATYAEILRILATSDMDPVPGTADEPAEPSLEELKDIPTVEEPGETAADPVGLDAAEEDQSSDPTLDLEAPTPEVDHLEGADAEGTDSSEEPPEVAFMPRPGPQIRLLGNVEVVVPHEENLEATKKGRLTELAAIIATHPGCDHTIIDACYSPTKRLSDNGRNTAMSKLRRWLGTTPEGDHYLPRYQSGAGYRLHEDVTTDWDQWTELLSEGPAAASTHDLEEALELVRGEPFTGVRARYYSWAEPLKQDMISRIVDASHELARRRLLEGRWRTAEQATLVGLRVEPGVERLWRLRISAAYYRGDSEAVQQCIERLFSLADEDGGELEPETEVLLGQIQRGDTPQVGAGKVVAP